MIYLGQSPERSTRRWTPLGHRKSEGTSWPPSSEQPQLWLPLPSFLAIHHHFIWEVGSCWQNFHQVVPRTYCHLFHHKLLIFDFYRNFYPSRQADTPGFQKDFLLIIQVRPWWGWTPCSWDFPSFYFSSLLLTFIVLALTQILLGIGTRVDLLLKWNLRLLHS